MPLATTWPPLCTVTVAPTTCPVISISVLKVDKGPATVGGRRLMRATPFPTSPLSWGDQPRMLGPTGQPPKDAGAELVDRVVAHDRPAWSAGGCPHVLVKALGEDFWSGHAACATSGWAPPAW